ncbi:hypothetical protein V7S43_018520 [Phytophthora oleae]|uniref:Cyclic nucleotide-binding domain-containing protein n=1 Tax=Phytophthora oleae TaxID=2107226 RepID=A0ABD3ER56_9STRA
MWSEYDTVHRDILGFTRKLPQSLALEVLHHRYSDLVSGLEFWPESSPEFVSALLLSVDIRVFGLADIILREGEVGTELFMIHRGFVELTGPVKEVQTLTQGCTFGELALLLDCTRATCVRTVTYVESCALDRQVFYRVLNRYPENRTRVVENVLAAGLRSNECPELWARAKTLFEDRTPVETDSSGVNDVKETQLSSSAAARILVQAMKLGKGPDMRTPACVHQDIADTNIRPNNGLVDTQILPVLTALSNSIRRLEDDFGLMKELVKEKLEKGESGVNEAAIELTLPQLSIKANESPATISSTNESTAIKDSDPTMFTSKVQAKPSRFRRAVSVSSLLDAARQMKHGSNVTVGDIRSSTSPDSRGLHPKMPPRRTLQRRMSR